MDAMRLDIEKQEADGVVLNEEAHASAALVSAAPNPGSVSVEDSDDSLPRDSDDESVDSDDSEVGSDCDPAPPANEMDADFFKMWNDRMNDNDNEDDAATLGELLVMYFDWMTTHKVTLTCARAVHSMLNMMMPADASSFPKKYSQLQAMLNAVYDHNVQQVHLCPYDCIAYVDATHPALLVENPNIPALTSGYKHAHRQFCPVCLTERYVTVKGKQVPAKVGYFFDPDAYFAGIFRDTDPAKQPWRNHGYGEHAPGHTANSRGYYRKMEEDERMKEEPRNIGLIGMADGKM